MPTVRKWSNVQVQMESARAAARTITAITKAAEGVVTSAAHGYTNGDYVFLEVLQGMYQLNGRIARVKGVTTDTFILEGIDTTSFETFVSGQGTASKLTFGTNITTALTVSGNGGSSEFIDITTIHDSVRRQMPGVAAAPSYEFEHIWDPSDSGLQAMKLASDAQSPRAFRFQWGTGGVIAVFGGYVSASLLPAGQALDKVTTQASVTMTGTPTYYAS